LPQAGRPGSFNDQIQKDTWSALDKIISNLAVPVIFFSKGVKNWEGYNAALRALQIGYGKVYWYRGGIDSWTNAKQPLTPSALR
jgi:hypothetical protein